MTKTREETERDCCDSCKHVFYDPDDRKELQRCRAVYMNPEPPINTEAIYCKWFARKERDAK